MWFHPFFVVVVLLLQAVQVPQVPLLSYLRASPMTPVNTSNGLILLVYEATHADLRVGGAQYCCS